MTPEKKHYYDLTEAIEIIERLKEERAMLQRILMRVVDVANGEHSAIYLAFLISDIASEARDALGIQNRNEKLK